jgi:hypothetical protein
MPWKETDAVSERARFVGEYASGLWRITRFTEVGGPSPCKTDGSSEEGQGSAIHGDSLLLLLAGWSERRSITPWRDTEARHERA